MAGIIILILLGIMLFVIEFLLVPGITVAGVGGLILTVLGIYKAFDEYGTTTGVWFLIGTILVSILVIAFSLRARTWRKLMLKTNNDSTVDTNITEDQIKVGDSGETLTRLAPMGKIIVNSIVREAKSIDGYIDEHSPVEIVSVRGTSITVKPIKK